MSMLRELLSAQVSDSPSPQVRTNIGFRNIGPSSFIRDFLEKFNLTVTPSARELYHLQLQLDNECLQLAKIAAAEQDIHSRNDLLDVNTIFDIAVFLSNSISQVTYLGTSSFHEIQLRALVSCLALLHYHGVRALEAEQWVKLNCTHSRKISFQLDSRSTLDEKVQFAPNVYLVRLLSQYLSFIGRGDSTLPLVVGPIWKILVGIIAIPSHQYAQVHHILEGLGQLLTLWRTAQTKYKALWGLQEYTRLATTLCRQAVESPTSSATQETAAVLVPALLEKVEALLDAERSTALPSFSGQMYIKIRAFFDVGPPDLDRSHYIIGILDCAAQLTTLLNPAMHCHSLMEKLMNMVLTCDVSQYRWKAIEVILSFRAIRTDQYTRLKSIIELNALPAIRDLALQELGVIHKQLERKEDTGLRLRIPPSLAIRTQHVADEILPAPRASHQSSNPDSGLSSTSSIENPNPLSQLFQEGDMGRPQMEAIQPLEKEFQSKGFLNGRFSRKDYDFAGLSSDCLHLVCFTERRVSVFHLGHLSTFANSSNFPMARDLTKIFKDTGPLVDAVMSSRFLVLVTTSRTLIVDVQGTYQNQSIIHGAWEPAGVACFDSGNRLSIAIGRGKGNSSKTSEGRIDIYSYRHEQGNRAPSPLLCETLVLPRQSQPKRVTFNADTRVITCVTRIHNKIFAWQLGENLKNLSKPFEFVKNRYSNERYETGITSTSLYTSEANNNYLLCTTSPSTERHRNDGEWSFVSPLPSIQTAATPRIRPPSNTIHNFDQFEKHRPLRAGAVSSKHSIFAVLEDTGRISLLPLDASPQGGICGVSHGMMVLKAKIGAVGGSLRFTPDGERLIAVDPKGKIVVVDFERES